MEERTLKNIVKNFIVILLIAVLIELVPLNISYAETNTLGTDDLMSLDIKGENRVIKKTTKIDEIKKWYKGEHIFETPSLFGGKAYSFYVGDNFESYLYIETIEDGTIFSYGAVDKTYKTNTYSYGDDYPNKDYSVLHGCLLQDEGSIIGGVYYNKNVLLGGKSEKIIALYRDNFEKAYAEENQIEVSEIGTEKDKKRQSKIMLDLNKHAVLMYNGIIHQFGTEENFLQTDRDSYGQDTFKTIEDLFYINNQFIEFGDSLFSHLFNMEYGTSKYVTLGSKTNCDITYLSQYVFNPLPLAGMAKLRKSTGKINVPVWHYNYELGLPLIRTAPRGLKKLNIQKKNKTSQIEEENTIKKQQSY